jgi:hypothetical protein
MINTLLQDVSLIKETVNHLSIRACNLSEQFPASSFIREIALITKQSENELLNLGLSPLPLKEGDSQSAMLKSILKDEGLTMWSEIDHLSCFTAQMIYLSIAYKTLRNQIKDLQKKNRNEMRLLEKMEIPGLATGSTLKDQTPIAKAFELRSSQLLKAYGELVRIEDERKFIYGSVKDVLIPQLNVLSLEVTPKSRKAIRLEKLILIRTLAACKAVNTRVVDGTLDIADKAMIHSFVTENETPEECF